MPAALTDEEIKNILLAWRMADDPSYSKVAQRTGHSKDTVKKYVLEYFEGAPGLDAAAERVENNQDVSSDDDTEMFSDQYAFSKQVSVSFPDRRMSVANDFVRFFMALNSECGLGIDMSVIRMLGFEVRVTGDLLCPDDVVEFIEMTNSGISSEEEIKWIRRLYSLWVQKYES